MIINTLTTFSIAQNQLALCRPKSLKDYVFPYAMALFLGSSLIFALVGGRHNAKLTVAFEDSFCKEPEGILWKQFTRLGRGSSPGAYRRLYCQTCLLAYLLQQFFGTEETLDLAACAMRMRDVRTSPMAVPL